MKCPFCSHKEDNWLLKKRAGKKEYASNVKCVSDLEIARIESLQRTKGYRLEPNTYILPIPL